MRTLGLALCLLLLASCNATVKLLESGDVVEQEFRKEIPFEMREGIMIVQVNLKGKNYDFIFDSGAPNVVSEEIAKELNLKNVHEQKISDSQGASSVDKIVMIDTIPLGGLNFVNTAAVVTDTRQSPVIACLGLDGFIGANLMRKVSWEIDFERNVLTMVDNIEDFTIPENAIKLPFRQKVTGTPIIQLEVEGMEPKDITIDLGSTGGFLIPSDINDWKKADALNAVTFGYGSAGSGIYGFAKPDTTYYAQAKKLSLGELSVENHAIRTGKNKVSLLGLEFLSNYLVHLDWENEHLYLTEVKPHENQEVKRKDAALLLKEGKIYVGQIIENSDAKMRGLEIGTQVVSINGNSCKEIDLEEWCELSKSYGEEKVTKIKVLEDGKEKEYTIEKRNILE